MGEEIIYNNFIIGLYCCNVISILLKVDHEYYIVSPYVLVWNGDNYYLIGFCDNRDHMRNFRLDRIYKTPALLENEPAIPLSKKFNLGEYTKKVFRMYASDQTVDVELLCESHVMNGVVDQFGPSVKIIEVDDEHFKAFVKICPSPTFYQWVFGWNGAMKIVAPENVHDEYKEMLMRALE